MAYPTLLGSMSPSLCVKLPDISIEVPTSAPPGLEAPSWPPGLEPPTCLCGPPGLASAKASDDTSTGSASWSTEAWQSETASFGTVDSEDTFLPKRNYAGELLLKPEGDNAWRVVNPSGRGVAYRWSKDKDHRSGGGVSFNSVVHGVDEGEWIKVQASRPRACSTESELNVHATAFVPTRQTTRTALKVDARAFKPQLPFVPMAEVSNAWWQWHAVQKNSCATMDSTVDMPVRPKQGKQSQRRLSRRESSFEEPSVGDVFNIPVGIEHLNRA